ncbi:hypothetical protein [Cylindrospermopsis raciborskii]|uniref:Uncharacterized protein n=1 Tax=Cylindrospermopsis raciborskii CENA302 TaxID=1170768 RepID=A0A9Q5W7M8_9CYAN|nr:hypothetical protein [Cylindrospermopsis raciborskii]MCZ2201007.1 hypothetical protein [Cylindrospermopsis raciborskii PAMP2012]MCZ2206148.1 hypothetical protein [Cylindrospermopsis raciborskii PAMP2011]NLQ06073.1 hypothetical protein [Cylindrospermopsis raciborskii MVCC19]OHY32383.1 hypothetical protein BCV64_13000 [Cylindrospermopsis raciborskii MVCC14]OPH08699.1 hypothetical protein CENA302_14335 [Cylindrospermopsis raciborskii CENA302]
MDIKISDLYLNGDGDLLQQVTPGEMVNIKGGVRRRRRNSNSVESGDISQVLGRVNDNLERWRVEIDDTLDQLRDSVTF